MPTTPDVDSLTGRDPEVIRLCARILRQTMWPYHRAEVRGLERVPKEGRLLYVGNHNGYPYMEELWLFLCGLYHEYGMQRFPFVAMHPFSINLPLLGPFFVRCGAIRASSQNAASVLEAVA